MCVADWSEVPGMPCTIQVIRPSTTTEAIGATPYVVASVSWLAGSRPSRGSRLGTEDSLAGAHAICVVSMMNVATAAQPTTILLFELSWPTSGIEANSTNLITSQTTI